MATNLERIFAILTSAPMLSLLASPSAIYAQTPLEPTYETKKLAAPSAGGLLGTIPPDDLSTRAAAQQHVSKIISKGIAAQEPAPGPDDARHQCSAQLERWDWREHDGVTEIRNQGPCGDAAIFASLAAFEASYRIVNKQTIHASEQQILNCAPHACLGEWHGEVLTFLTQRGVVSAEVLPYNGFPNKEMCKIPDKPTYLASNWAIIDPRGGQASVAAIKQALCEHGPIVTAVSATRDFLGYAGGVFNEFPDLSESDVNHDVVIVGWDDASQSWTIQNSWGPQWGESGYMRIRYNSNNIGVGAAWIDAAPTATNLSPSNLEALNQKAFKSLPGNDAAILLTDTNQSQIAPRAVVQFEWNALELGHVDLGGVSLSYRPNGNNVGALER